jgi:hypothetical protein
MDRDSHAQIVARLRREISRLGCAVQRPIRGDGAVVDVLYTALMGSVDRDDEHSEPVAVGSFATEGEAEVVQAKLRAYGIEAALNDQIEGGAVVVEGESGVVVEVPAADAQDARRILSDDDSGLGEPSVEP